MNENKAQEHQAVAMQQAIDLATKFIYGLKPEIGNYTRIAAIANLASRIYYAFIHGSVLKPDEVKKIVETGYLE